MELAAEGQPVVAHDEEVLVGEPVRGEEEGAVAQRVVEAHGVHGHRAVLRLAAAVQVPVELLVPHHVREVHVVQVASQVLATGEAAALWAPI